jgi:K+-transporting ATPase ATPase C chain
MIRRHLYASLMLTLLVAVGVGLVYPLVVYGIGQAAFPHRADGSFITRNGQVVGSSLIGQNFLGKDGNPDPRYFQPRPSASGLNGYDPSAFTCPPTSTTCGASSASNLGPSDPRLVGFIPGFNTVDLNGNPSKTNPFANSSDPYSVPTDKQGNAVISPAPGQKYAKNSDGTYVCSSGTVPERASAYRQLNNLSDKTLVPVDAVTASGSGLDPDITVANAELQAPRVAQARHVSIAAVRRLIDQHTNGKAWAILGEKTINVLDLNLALNDHHM